MKKELVKHNEMLQENLVSQMYSLDQEIYGASLDLKIKNQCTLQEWFLKSIVMTIEINRMETCRKLKERIKEHRSDSEKDITGLSQHMKEIRHKLAWKKIEMIYYEINWKERKFKKASRIPFHKKDQLKNEREERKTISNI